MNNNRNWILGLCFILGMALFALLAGHTIRTVKRMDEFVTVKGLSEREMPADLAIWPVAFTVTENDLTRLQEQIQAARKTVHQFLAETGSEPAEVSNAAPQIIDAQASGGIDGSKRPFCYQANITVLLRRSKVAKVKTAIETCDKLAQQGIVLRGGDYMSKPQFLFTGLDQIKPDMIQEANRNSRKAAEKFGVDSNSQVGAIRHAIQRPFEINDVDSSSPDRKSVRVATTVDFYLQYPSANRSSPERLGFTGRPSGAHGPLHGVDGEGKSALFVLGVQVARQTSGRRMFSSRNPLRTSRGKKA